MINSKWTQCVAASVFCVSCSQVQVLRTKSINSKNKEAFWISALLDLQGFFKAPQYLSIFADLQRVSVGWGGL